MLKPTTTSFTLSDLASFEHAPGIAEFPAGVQIHASDQALLQAVEAATVEEDA